MRLPATSAFTVCLALFAAHPARAGYEFRVVDPDNSGVEASVHIHMFGPFGFGYFNDGTSAFAQASDSDPGMPPIVDARSASSSIFAEIGGKSLGVGGDLSIDNVGLADFATMSGGASGSFLVEIVGTAGEVGPVDLRALVDTLVSGDGFFSGSAVFADQSVSLPFNGAIDFRVNVGQPFPVFLGGDGSTGSPGTFSASANLSISIVPEPSSWALLLIGLVPAAAVLAVGQRRAAGAKSSRPVFLRTADA